ncbi:MAG: hypothetical protein DLM53_09700 [Candidatus Eremiobacter antarcticus]|nr:hypothetical protein [Candidatus Eremiobacteraeota bacterium]MBC5807453.1 hypothetical protein [Candidatus Eremiobacteraeota bacterium]PZR61485.1 MAG: hypothetical protein DLM53_09700 [Candidatus Eremiobacter sp. RRmetagenome_bin22]
MDLLPHDLGDNKHGYIIHAVLQILQDGRVHSTDQILESGKSSGLLPKTLGRKSLYIHITGYIQRQQASGRKPLIIQDPKNRYFKLNRPEDAWPPYVRSEDAPRQFNADQIIQRLQATSVGDDPVAFEQAACDAIEALGFLVKHIGGYKAPDAQFDAPLGPLAYRVTLECEAAQSGIVRRIGGVAEAARHRDVYKADYCALLGPAFEKLGALDAELQNHEVAAFSVEDVATLIRMDANPYQAKPLFMAGRAENKLDDLRWDRAHGAGQRIATIANIVIELGWNMQVLAANQGTNSEAPLLNEDAAMMLVDTWLQQHGGASGCARDEVRAAFEYLTNPMVGRAVYSNEARNAIVLTTPRSLLIS